MSSPTVAPHHGRRLSAGDRSTFVPRAVVHRGGPDDGHLRARSRAEHDARRRPDWRRLRRAAEALRPRDPRLARPIVVVRVDPDPDSDIHFVARTKDRSADGVDHPRDRELDLNLDGVWEPTPYSMRRQRLSEPGVDRRGVVPEPYLSEVLKMWREGLS